MRRSKRWEARVLVGGVIPRHNERGKEGPVEECSRSDVEVRNEWKKVDNEEGWGVA